MPDNKSIEVASQRRAGRKPIIWLMSAALFLGLTATGFAVVFTIFGSTPPRFDMRLLEPKAIILILAFLVIYFLSDGLRLYFVLRAVGAEVKLREIFPLVFINILFSNVTPLATGGGFAQVWYLQRHDVPVGISAAATTIRTILAMLTIFVAAPLFQFLHSDVASGSAARITIQSLSTLIVLYLIGFVILLKRPFWIASLAGMILSFLSRLGLIAEKRTDRWRAAVLRETAEFSGSFSKFVRGRRRDVVAAVVSTLAFLLTLFAFPALLLEILEYEVDWITVVGTLSIVTFLMYFAPTPGGAGFAELAFAGFMAGQIAETDLLLVIFAWRFLTVYLGMGIGIAVSAIALRLRAQTG